MHGKFPMKERKLFLVGPPDSEKTSWFAPFQGEHYTYFNTFKVVLLFSFSCDFKCLLTNPIYFSNNSSKQGINISLCIH